MASTCFHALFLRSYHWSSEICGVCSMARSDEECVLRIEIYSDKLLLEGTSTVLAVYLRLQLFWKAKKKTGVLKHPLSAVSSAKSNHYQVWWTGLLRLHENKWMLLWSNVSIMALLYFEVTPHFWGKLFWIMICQILFADQLHFWDWVQVQWTSRMEPKGKNSFLALRFLWKRGLTIFV